jgi:sulfite exporter TauE/SafE
MNPQSREKLAMAVLLMLFIFVLGNMVFNLENLDLGDEKVPQFIPQSESAQNVATNQTLTNAIYWIYFGFLGFCVVMVIIGIASFTVSKDKKKWRKLLTQMAGVLLVILVIFAIGYFYEDIESTVTGVGSTNVLPGGGGNASLDGNATTPTEAPSSVKIIITFGVFALIFLFCLAVLMAFQNIMKMRSAKMDYSDIEKDKKEVARTIQRTIDELGSGSDTRTTVIRCYTDMCRVIAKHGVKEEEHLTPREFQKLALDTLPVPEEQMEALVNVFEEARYSQHILDNEASKRAVDALEAVKSKLVVEEPEPQSPEVA